MEARHLRCRLIDGYRWPHDVGRAAGHPAQGEVAELDGVEPRREGPVDVATGMQLGAAEAVRQATSLAFSGAAVALSGGLLIQVNSSAFLVLGQSGIGAVQYSVLVFVGVALLLQGVLALTIFGRRCYGVGGNPRAARQSGVRTDRLVVTTFVVGGLGTGLAGLINASAQGSGDSSAGTTLSLIAIAAVALGGTSIFGGAGAVWRTVIGVLLLALIVNGFDLLGVAAFYQDMVEGALIVAAVAVGSLVRTSG